MTVPSTRVTDATHTILEEAGKARPINEDHDFADVERGFVAASADRQIKAADGRVVWDLDAYEFLRGPCPETAHPGLWRQGQLLARDGLFEVVPGVYQARGFDASVMSFIEGERGVIVVDPLISTETAAAAWSLYRQHRGDRPVAAMVYTHSHVDHFGGVRGVISDEDVASGRVEVIAPEGFMQHAVSENVFAGPAMSRRAAYMYGTSLPKGPDGQIGVGLGQAMSTGQVTLIPPTFDITETGQDLTVDGVRIVFQVTPGTEAPAEMNFYLPGRRALCAAENATHTMHNVLTLRGAQVRDARAWAMYLNETIALWGDELEVVFASHHWPTWGRERAVEFLAAQRDMYAYLHDQTVRLLNRGATGAEIAEELRLPPALERAWHTHGYYGSLSHNTKAVYQRYLGWYDGNPAHLWPHPPVEAGRRYVSAMGGAGAAMGVARAAFIAGDYRWAVEVLSHILFSGHGDAETRELAADAFEQLGFGAENGTWRNEFLAAADELRHGVFGTPIGADQGGILEAMTAEQIFGALAIQIDGPRAWDDHLMLSWVVTDTGLTYVTELRNGALTFRQAVEPADSGPTVTIGRRTLAQICTGTVDLESAVARGVVGVDGDASVVQRLLELVAPLDPNFAVITP